MSSREMVMTDMSSLLNSITYNLPCRTGVATREEHRVSGGAYCLDLCNARFMTTALPTEPRTGQDNCLTIRVSTCSTKSPRQGDSCTFLLSCLLLFLRSDDYHAPFLLSFLHGHAPCPSFRTTILRKFRRRVKPESSAPARRSY